MAEGKRRFGSDRKDWKFKCVSCGTVQSARDFVEGSTDKDAMIKSISGGIVGFSCIGRYVKNIGCDWTLGGLFSIHEAVVKLDDRDDVAVFKFAEPHDTTVVNKGKVIA